MTGALPHPGAAAPVHGVLLLDKPLGLSSNDALQKVKWLLRAEKSGPYRYARSHGIRRAASVLWCGCKFSQLQLDAPRPANRGVAGRDHPPAMPRATVDAARCCQQVTPERLAAVQPGSSPAPSARCPPCTARSKDGKALCEYARAGIAVEREPRARSSFMH